MSVEGEVRDLISSSLDSVFGSIIDNDPAPTENKRILEDGSYRILEDGSYRLLEEHGG